MHLEHRSIDLVQLNISPTHADWYWGKNVHTGPNIQRLNIVVKELIHNNPETIIFFWDCELGPPDLTKLISFLDQPIDLWHAGLQLGVGRQPGLLDFVAPTWTFNRDPDPVFEATSWRVSLRACMVHSGVIHQLGFLNPSFESLTAASLEWGHRCIQQGVLMRHNPSLLPAGFKALPNEDISFSDQLQFIDLRYGRKWAAWTLLRAVLSGYAPLRHALPAWTRLQQQRLPLEQRIYQSPEKDFPAEPLPAGKKPGVSVLVPTLERYPYLRTLLLQLGEQSHPPDEILVIDQTPPNQREIQFYQEFKNLPLRVFYQEQAGQCSSRNLGLQASKGDYILFLDDDDEIPPDLLEKHLQHLESSAADASCGGADEIGAGPLPWAFTFRRASDVFPTNNTLLRKSALLKSGLFDLAYEHGARADGDLGMRLYLSGALMVLQPEIHVLHHHAPRGGLRAYKARKITYASSRNRLLQRHLPGITQLYLIRRYFSKRQVREQAWISILGTFSLHKSGWRRWIKMTLSSLLLPHSLWVLWRRSQIAEAMLEQFPKIPQLKAESDH